MKLKTFKRKEHIWDVEVKLIGIGETRSLSLVGQHQQQQQILSRQAYE